MKQRTGLAVLALVLLFRAPPTDAAPPHPRVSLKVSPRKGAHGCPSEKELQQKVAAILGYSPFRKQAPRRVTSVLSSSGSTLHARIELFDTHTHKRLGVRELSSTGPACEELGQAMALAIALAIDPLAQPPPARPAASAPPSLAKAPPPPRPSAFPVEVGAAGTLGAAAGASGASASSAPATRPTAPLAEAVPAPAEAERPAPTVAAPDAGLPAAAALEAALVPTKRPDAGSAMEAGPALDAGPALAAAEAPDAGPALAAAEAPDAGPPPAVVAAPEVPAAAPVAPEAPAEVKPWHALVGAGAEWTAGLVPHHAFGVLLHGGLVFSFASVELEATWLPSTSLAFAPGTISSTLVTGALVGCARFGGFGACGLFETGPFHSQGTGYAQSQSQTTWAVAVGVRAQWDWVFAHPVGLRLQADGLVNVVRTRLLVGSDVVWQAPSFALALGAGVFFVF